jgi:hypothetical protein
MLHDGLGGEGVHALHAVIVGPIGPGGHDPADVAEAMWRAAERRAEQQIVLR